MLGQNYKLSDRSVL